MAAAAAKIAGWRRGERRPGAQREACMARRPARHNNAAAAPWPAGALRAHEVNIAGRGSAWRQLRLSGVCRHNVHGMSAGLKPARLFNGAGAAYARHQLALAVALCVLYVLRIVSTCHQCPAQMKSSS